MQAVREESGVSVLIWLKELYFAMLNLLIQN
jgi:hypothetical protein